MLARCLVLVAALGACQEGERPRGIRHGTPKPSAPVDVAIEARPLGGDVYEVTLTATPSRDVGALELVLDGERVEVGATAAGEPRRLTRRIELDAPGREVIGAAATGTGRHRRSRAAVAELGAVAAKPVRRTTIVTMPDGTRIEEVR
jgi:hypothetical protein